MELHERKKKCDIGKTRERKLKQIEAKYFQCIKTTEAYFIEVYGLNFYYPL